LPFRALGERYASSKYLVAIFEVKGKEFLVVARLVSVTANGPGEVKGQGTPCIPRGQATYLDERISGESALF
jgi:hypothetical protein